MFAWAFFVGDSTKVIKSNSKCWLQLSSTPTCHRHLYSIYTDFPGDRATGRARQDVNSRQAIRGWHYFLLRTLYLVSSLDSVSCKPYTESPASALFMYLLWTGTLSTLIIPIFIHSNRNKITSHS